MPPPQAGPYPGYPPPGYVQPGYPPPGYAQPGFAQPGFAQPGFAQPGYPPPGYAQPGYPQPGYPPPGYAQPGYPQAHYAQPGYAQPGHPQSGYPPAGYPPAGYPPAGWAYPGGPTQPAVPGWSGLAIASLVFGIIGGIVLAAGFGIGALVMIRRTGERGRRLAIAGLSLAGAWTVAAVVITVFLANVVWKDGGGLQAGDCVNDVQGARPVVSCYDLHDGEVYATFDLPDGPWPGDQQVMAQAETRCLAELQDYLADPSGSGRLRSTYLLPQASTWPDDRKVICIVRDPAGPMTDSLGY